MVKVVDVTGILLLTIESFSVMSVSMDYGLGCVCVIELLAFISPRKRKSNILILKIIGHHCKHL